MEFLHLDSRPTLYAAPRGADRSFCFGEEVVQENSYTPIKIGTIQRRLTEMTRTIVKRFKFFKHSRFFSPLSLAPDMEAFGRSL